MQRSPKPPAAPIDPHSAIEMLSSLGLGPDTVLMNDPKLFVDGRFLASLLVELDDELGPHRSALALFQIGLLHGLRDAARVSRQHDSLEEKATASDTLSLAMSWVGPEIENEAERLMVAGRWPEQHEASARCARRGPSDAPSCWMSAGYTTGWLSGALEQALIVREVECAATGAPECRFEAREATEWLDRGDETIDWLLSSVPFETFRKLAINPPVSRDTAPPAPGDGSFDRAQAVVHIWGPVMVLPFTNLDEALGTVDMLGRDPGIGEIRSVVVDLREEPLDEGFGAAALEQILETIESWGAQSLITGVSPGSEAVVESLEASHLVLRKDLTEAIATAFQIADAQRQPL